MNTDRRPYGTLRRMPTLWSVRLLLPAEDERSLRLASPVDWPVSQQLERFTYAGGSGIGTEEQPYLGFVLVADSADAAEAEAQQLTRQMMEGDLGEGPLPVAWVAPMRGDDPEGHRYLDDARDLLDSECYGLAVLSAQVHLELQVRTLLERAVSERGQAWPARLIKARPWTALRSPASKGAVEAILGIDPASVACWPEVAAHIERRNAVAHEGQRIERRDAERSITAVESFWATLAAHVRG